MNATPDLGLIADLVNRPLGRIKVALRRSQERLDAVCEVIQASRRCGRSHRGRAFRDLWRASGWLTEAVEQVDHAIVGLRESEEAIRVTAGYVAGAGQAFAIHTMGVAAATMRVAQVSEELQTVMDAVLAGAKRQEARRALRAPRPFAAALFDHDRRPADRIQSLIRRRRRIAADPVEDAPRRVSRGRAPPLLSPCSL